MRVEPYLYFNGRCEEAVGFYQKTLGAEVIALNKYGDAGKVMHSQLRIGGETVLASDGQREDGPNFQGFSLSITAETDGEVERLFSALSEGGAVHVPLTSTPFASRFAMLADRFGLIWTIASHQNVAAPN